MLPKYVPKSYKDAAELDAYIASAEYKTDKENPGVCMGIEHHVNEDQPNNYTFSFHFPDQSFGTLSFKPSMAIPNQQNDVWSPYASAPDLESYYRYQHNGYSNQQSILAN